jgi:hypothetical protein
MADDTIGKSFTVIFTNGDLPTNPMSLREWAVRCSPATSRGRIPKSRVSRRWHNPLPSSRVGIGSQALLADSIVGITAPCARLQRPSRSQRPQERSDIRRRPHPLYVWVIGKNRMEQSRALLDTELVVTHSLAGVSALHGRIIVRRNWSTARMIFELFHDCVVIRTSREGEGQMTIDA